MVKVETPDQMVRGYTDVYRPTLSNGSMHALPMTDEEKQEASEKPRPQFGFHA